MNEEEFFNRLLNKIAKEFGYDVASTLELMFMAKEKKVEQLENIRKIAIAFVKNNKDKTIAPYGDNEDTDYEVCLFEDDINDLLNILNKGE